MRQRKNRPISKSAWWLRVLCGLVLITIITMVLLLLRPGDSVRRVGNVVLISIDTCRADYVGCYGNPRRITPNVDKIAGQGTIFKNVITSVPLTLPAHCSMLTGTIPPYHQVHDNLDYKLDESNVTLAEILKEHGFVTAGIISASILDSQFGISQGFDMFNDHLEDERGGGLMVERSAEATTRLALEWLAQNKSKRFFLFLHYFDPHFDYTPPEPFASRFADNLYAGEIAYADYCIGRVIQALKDLGLFDAALIIITGDHGEMLGEHGELTHGYFIYQSAVKVPLIFKLPDQTKSRQVESVAGLIDIVPTVCSLLNIRPPEVQGKDLSPYLFGKSVPGEERHIYTESLIPTKYNANSLLGIVSKDVKYIQTTRPELYNLENDPDESQNLVDDEPQKARILQGRLREILEASVQEGRAGSNTVLDEQARKRLESLGYVSGSVAEEFEFDQSKDDPKDMIDLHVSVEKIHHLIARKELDEAKRLCEELLLRHDDYYGLYRHLGRIYFEEGDKQKAQAYMRKSLELNPDQPGLHFNLGMLLAEQGKYDDAAQHLKEVLRLNPDQILAHNKLALVLEAQGDLDGAIYHLSESLRIKADQHDAHNQIARLFYKMGRFDEAVKHWRLSLRLKPDQPEVQSNIAAALTQKQKPLPDHFGEVHE
jgi:arylsulfatase A-like enzyme/Tfp pilus assembly protein PilF